MFYSRTTYHTTTTTTQKNNPKKEEAMPKNDSENTATAENTGVAEETPVETPVKETAPVADEATEAEVDSADENQSAELLEAKADTQRVMAEYVNYRKRVEREKVTAGNNGAFKVLQSVIPVLDEIELALRHDSENIPEPVQRIFAKLVSSLEGAGLDVVNESGVPFDPTIHEGILYQEVEGVDPEHVATVTRTGYRMTTDNRVIRGAQVIIAK